MTVSYSTNYPSYPNQVQGYNYQKDVKGGGFAAMLGGCAVSCLATPVSPILQKAVQNSSKYSETETTEIRNAAQKILENRKLAEKGVKIKVLDYVDPKNDSLAEKLAILYNPYEQVKRGQNALFLARDLNGVNLLTGEKTIIAEKNTILVPEKHMQGQLFHEIGHADNLNNSKVLKALQKVRPVALYLPVAILLYGAFSKNSKPKDGNNELTGAQKTNNFIRNNAGKLSFLAMLPIVVEEAAASIKGYKFAKEFASKDIANKLVKPNCFGLATYVVTAIAAGLASRAAVKIKDNKIAKKEQELQFQRGYMA